MLLGFVMIFIASVSVGALAIPLKYQRVFQLENTYVVNTAVMMLLLPSIMSYFVLPHLTTVIQDAAPSTLWTGIAFGFGWGLGSVLFGYGVTMSGMSVGYAVIMGTNTAAGSLIPLIITSGNHLDIRIIATIVLGVLCCVAGVAVCGRAGLLRETQKGKHAEKSVGAVIALLVCILSGVLSSFVNLGFSFTAKLGAAERAFGAAPVYSTLASWLPVFWGAALALFLWFGGLQIKRRSWLNYSKPGAGRDGALAAAMGGIWFLGTIPYGIGAYYLGQIGTSVGWALYVTFSLIVANIIGFITGEWRGAPPESIRTLCMGLGILIVAIALLGSAAGMVGG